jgi:pyruvate/2-oxoglutarate/acetoin dehydrogenase E1 component
MLANKFLNYTLFYIQAIDHIINSAAKSNYMSAGQISVPIVLRGPNGAAAGVGAQHSQVFAQTCLYMVALLLLLELVPNTHRFLHKLASIWLLCCCCYSLEDKLLCQMI